MSPLRPDRRADLVFRTVDDDFFVYDPVGDRVVLLNATSAFVLDLCDGTRTWEEIAAQVAAVFQADHERVARDVESMRRELTTAGLLQRAPAE